MKHTAKERDYQQSSRDASEEDAGDNDSIASTYDSSADNQLPRPPNKMLINRNADEGENSGTTSDVVGNGYISQQHRRQGDQPVRAIDMADKRYIDVNSAAGKTMNLPPTDRPVRVYSDGIFDLFHLGYRLHPCSR